MSNQYNNIYPNLHTQYPTPSAMPSYTAAAGNGYQYPQTNSAYGQFGQYPVQHAYTPYTSAPSYAAQANQYYAGSTPTATTYPSMEFPVNPTATSYSPAPYVPAMATHSVVPPMQTMTHNFQQMAMPAPQIDYNGNPMMTALPMANMPSYPAFQINDPYAQGQYGIPGNYCGYNQYVYNPNVQIPTIIPSAPMETIVHQEIAVTQPEFQVDEKLLTLQRDYNFIHASLVSAQGMVDDLNKTMEIIEKQQEEKKANKPKKEHRSNKSNEPKLKKGCYLFERSTLQGKIDEAVREAEEFRTALYSAELALVEYKSQFQSTIFYS